MCVKWGAGGQLLSGCLLTSDGQIKKDADDVWGGET